jgi:branched-chain amino acid transport system permease protein
MNGTRTRLLVPIVVAALVIVGAVAPLFLTAFWLSLVTQVLIFAVFASSINLIAGYGGMVTLGQAGIFASSGYGVAIVATRFQLGWPLQVLIGLAVAVVFSAIFGAMAVRTTGVYFLMVTLAQGMVIWGLAYSLSTYTGGDSGIPNVARPAFVAADPAFYELSLAVVVVILLGMTIFVRSPFGLGLRAIQANEGRARSLGYHTAWQRFVAFVMAGALAGVGGILYVYQSQFISPSAAFFKTSADGTAMSLIGGLGTIAGPLVGAAIVIVIRNEVSSYVSFWPTIEGVIFILVVLYARQGIVGLVQQRLRIRRIRRDAAQRVDERIDEEALDPLAQKDSSL